MFYLTTVAGERLFLCVFICVFFLGKFYAFWLYCFAWHQDLFSSSFLHQLEMIGTVDAVDASGCHI